MAQVNLEVFSTEERKLEKKRKELIDRGMMLWEQYAREYRILPLKYLFLLEEKRKKNLPLHKLHSSHLEDYPEVPLFRIFEESEARAVLSAMESDQLRREIEDIEYFIEADRSWRAMRAWVIDASYRLTHKKPAINSLVR